MFSLEYEWIAIQPKGLGCPLMILVCKSPNWQFQPCLLGVWSNIVACNHVLDSKKASYLVYKYLI